MYKTIKLFKGCSDSTLTKTEEDIEMKMHKLATVGVTCVALLMGLAACKGATQEEKHAPPPVAETTSKVTLRSDTTFPLPAVHSFRPDREFAFGFGRGVRIRNVSPEFDQFFRHPQKEEKLGPGSLRLRCFDGDVTGDAELVSLIGGPTKAEVPLSKIYQFIRAYPDPSKISSSDWFLFYSKDRHKILRTGQLFHAVPDDPRTGGPAGWDLFAYSFAGVIPGGGWGSQCVLSNP